LSCNDSAEIDYSAVSDSTSTTGFTGDEVKLIKKAHISLKVKDVQESLRSVSVLVRELGGMIRSQHYQSSENESKELKISNDSLLVVTTYSPVADITIRIPSAELETFLFTVSDLGYFTVHSNLDIDDKSLDYLQHEMLRENRREVLSSRQPALKTNIATAEKTTIATVAKTIDIKDEMVFQQIANRSIDADVKYSTVNLSLFQNALIRKEVVSNYIISGYQVSFAQRARNAFINGWDYFSAFVLVILNLWMFIVLAAAAYFSYRFAVKRKVKR